MIAAALSLVRCSASATQSTSSGPGQPRSGRRPSSASIRRISRHWIVSSSPPRAVSSPFPTGHRGQGRDAHRASSSGDWVGERTP